MLVLRCMVSSYRFGMNANNRPKLQVSSSSVEGAKGKSTRLMLCIIQVHNACNQVSEMDQNLT